MPRSAAPASGVIRWIASVAGRAGYLTALLLAVQSVLALCGVGYALILRALIDAATAGQTLCPQCYLAGGPDGFPDRSPRGGPPPQ